MSDPMIFQFIGDSINNDLDTYISVVAGNTISFIATLAVTAGGLYYATMGLLMAVGRVDGPFSQLVMSCIKFMLIAAFALNIGTYTTWVVDSVHGMETGFADAFSGDKGAQSSSIYATLDGSVGKGWDIAAQLYEKGNNRGWTEMVQGISELFLSLLVAGATLVLAVPAGAMIIATHAVLSILLGIGPLFILAIGWGPTKGFFDRWFGAICTAVLQVALVSAVLAIAVGIFAKVVAKIDLDSATQSTLFACLTLVVVTAIMLYLMYKVFEYGGHLGGGMASAAITLGALAIFAARTGGAANSAINPTSTRRDLESGMMVSGSRFDHMSAGNTMWNPAYRQHVFGQFGKNWGRSRGGSATES